MMESQKLIFGLWYRKGKLTDISVRFAKLSLLVQLNCYWYLVCEEQDKLRSKLNQFSLETHFDSKW